MEFLIAYLLANGKKKYKPLILLGLSMLLRRKPALLAKTLSCAKRSADGSSRQFETSLHVMEVHLFSRRSYINFHNVFS